MKARIVMIALVFSGCSNPAGGYAAELQRCVLVSASAPEADRCAEGVRQRYGRPQWDGLAARAADAGGDR